MSADVAGIIRAVLQGAVTAASAATGLSEAQSREALLAELGELRATPPRPVDVDVAELDEAFERARRSREAVDVLVPRVHPVLLERVRPVFERAGIHVDNLEPHLAPRPLAIVRALEHSAAAIAVELPDDALRAKALDLIKSSIVLVAAEHPDSRVTEEPPAP